MYFLNSFRHRVFFFTFVFTLVTGLFQNCAPVFKSQSNLEPKTSEVDPNLLSIPTIVVQPIGGASGLVNSSNLTIPFEIIGVPQSYLKTVTCQLGADVAVDCFSKQVALNNLIDQDYSLTIHVETLSGMTNELKVLFRKDGTSPTIVVSSTPAALTNQSSASFTFSSTDNLSGVDHSECSTDGAAFVTCESPKILSNLAVGPHSFKIRSFDKAMNQSSDFAYNWTVDLTIPTVLFSSTPTMATNNRSAEFSFSGAGIVNYECQIDGAGFSSCESPKHLTGLSSASHVFQVRGKNAVGTWSEIASYTWIVDTLAPTKPALATDTRAATNSKSAQFIFSSSDPLSGIDRYECAFNTYIFTICNSPKILENLSDGNQNMRVRAIDKAANVSDITEFNWVIDTIMPVLTITQKPDAISEVTSVVIAFQASDSLSGLKQITCSLDGVLDTNCASPKQMTSTVGNHNFVVTAIDNVGNESQITVNWQTISEDPIRKTLDAIPNLIICKPAIQPFLFKTESGIDTTYYHSCQQVCSDWAQCAVETVVRGVSQLEISYVVDEDGMGNGFGGTLRFTKTGNLNKLVMFHKGGSGTDWIDDFLPGKVEAAGGIALQPKWIQDGVGWFARPFARSRLERNLAGVSLRPAAVMKWIYQNLTKNTFATAGCSGGSIATYYPRLWHGLDVLMRYQLLGGGPVMAKIEGGCRGGLSSVGRCTSAPSTECNSTADCGPTGGLCSAYEWGPGGTMSAVRLTIDHLHAQDTGPGNFCFRKQPQPLFLVSNHDNPIRTLDVTNEHKIDFLFNISSDPQADNGLNVVAQGASVFSQLTGAKSWNIQPSGIHCDAFNSNQAWDLLRVGAGL